MKTENQRQQKFVSRLEAIGVLHQDAVAVAALTLRWARSSGEEWTVKRFKALKLEFITSVLATDCTIVRAPWFSRRSDGSISGPFRRFWVDPHYVAHPQTVLNAFQVYSSFVSSSATPLQLEKFLDSARALPVSLPESLDQFIHNRSWKEVQGCLNLNFSPYWKAYRSPIKRVPALVGTAPEDQLNADLQFAASSGPVGDMYANEFEVMSLSLSEDMLQAFRSGPNHPFVGTISYIQEAGYKLRAVANPTRVVQNALEPLKRVLGEVLKTFPEDCTFNQDSGVRWCQHQLQKGKTLFSIDLSDATNLFPFEIQESVLFKLAELCKEEPTRVAFHQLSDVFRRAAKAEWRLPDGTSLRFTKGQPLGLGPSFFLFALSHHMVLYSLAGRGQYVILGDDVVISDPKLAKKYRLLMEELGCAISETKSIASRHLAEFASRLIRPNDVLRQWKWREITRSNVIDICRNMGPKFLSQVAKPMRGVIEALAPIPKELGGLGWNPKGLPLSSRIDSSVAAHLLFSLKENWEVLRRWRSCAVSDFLTAHITFQGESPDKLHLHPFLDKDIVTMAEIGLSLMDDSDWSKRFYERQVWELLDLDRPGQDLGETVLYPDGLKRPVGYLHWGPPPNPWKEETGGLYRVVARILRGEGKARIS